MTDVLLGQNKMVSEKGSSKGGLLLIHSPKNLCIGFPSSSYGQLFGIKRA